MSSTSQAAAQDAAVETTGELGRRKAYAAVEYHRREVASAEQAVTNAIAKAEKFRGHADDATEAVAAAEDEVEAAKSRLSDAEAAVEQLGGDR